jgi:PIN domain nuclease of toxin-antitoxin system
MHLLLDTHALHWVLLADPQLGPGARHLVERGAERVHVSVVSLWGVAVKSAKGSLATDARAAEAALVRSGYLLLDVTRGHVLALADLPVRPDHRDPFDRMLVAQARHEGLTLMTSDAKLSAYGVATVGCG